MIAIAIFILCGVMLLAIEKTSWTTFRAQDLYSTLVEETEEKAVYESGSSGFLTYGPYLDLTEGVYEIKISYACDTDGNYFDVCSNGGQTIHTQGELSPQTKDVDVCLEFSEDVSGVEVRTFYSGNGAMSVERIAISRVNNNSPFIKTVLAVIGALSVVLWAFLFKKCSKMPKSEDGEEWLPRTLKQRLKTAVRVAVFFSLTICVLGPIDLYTSNANDFWFSFMQILPIIGVAFLLIVGISVGILLLFQKKSFYYVIALEIGAACGFYVQGSYLRNDFGVLDGRTIDWSQYLDQMMVSVLVWGICIITPLLLVALFKQDYVEKVFRWSSGAVTCVEILSIAMLLATAPTLDSNADFVFSKEGQFQVSSEQNIVVFVLDTFDQSFLDQTLDEYPEYREKFKDFTRFTDVVGGGAPTHFGMPALLTGEICFDNNQYEEYKREAYAAQPIYEDLKKNDFDARIYSVAEYFSEDLVYEEFDNAVKAGLEINSYYGMACTLYKLVLFKYSPQVLKPMFWLSSDEFSKYGQAVDYDNYQFDDVLFHQEMMAQGLDVITDKSIFRLYHLFGVHGPYTISENIERIEEGTMIQSCRAALNIVYDYIELLRKAEVYDNTTIMILADHGAVPVSNVYESPMLMLKEKNSNRSTMAINAAPVTFKEVLPTLAKSFVNGSEFERYGATLFDIPEYQARARLHVTDNTLTKHYCNETNPSGVGVYEIRGTSGDPAAIYYMGDGKEYYEKYMKP